MLQKMGTCAMGAGFMSLFDTTFNLIRISKQTLQILIFNDLLLSDSDSQAKYCPFQEVNLM